MTLQKMALSVVATVASFAFTPALRADTHVALAGFGVSVGTPGFGFWIGQAAPERHHYYYGPVYRDYGPPWRPRYVRVLPPPAVIVRPPVVVEPAPPVVVTPAPPVVQESPITVWFMNSNGSRTSVQIARHGRWYVGPRGEYYDQMPTNEQLRLAYGF